MKKILLHGAAIDNAGGFQDAGSELEVGEENEAGKVSAERAKELVKSGRAVAFGASGSEGEAGDGLDKLTKDRLLQIARDEEVAVEEGATKATIVDAIRARRIAAAAAIGTGGEGNQG